MSESRNYVVILPDGSESFHDVRWDADRRFNEGKLHDMALTAIRQAKMTTPRKNPQAVTVQVARLEIKQGQVVRSGLTPLSVTPPAAPMTEVEFNEEMAEVTAELPEEFAAYVARKAWEDGHANGYEEVASIAGNMASELKPVVAKYTDRLKKKK